ncbi:MAG TPA: vitamin K epoxide reductase family protein [Ktedonobacterales bacterium]
MAVRHEAYAPPGWSYNPSSWSERRPLLVLAAFGLAAAIYTACEQLGIVAQMWDPFFGSQSSYLVTHSVISRLLPIPDGLLGVVGYLCDLIFGALGTQDRWRRLPGVVLLFGLIITGLGVVSVALTILQGVVILHWCTVCLISAAISMLIFGLGIGEVLASLQYLARERARGYAFWPALWGSKKRPTQQRRKDAKRMTEETASSTTEQPMDGGHVIAH